MRNHTKRCRFHYAAAQENSKFSGLRAPATTSTDSRWCPCGCQHLPKVPEDLQRRIARRYHDPVNEVAHRCACRLALFEILVLQRFCKRANLLLEHARHARVERGQLWLRRSRRDSRFKFGLLLIHPEQVDGAEDPNRSSPRRGSLNSCRTPLLTSEPPDVGHLAIGT